MISVLRPERGESCFARSAVTTACGAVAALSIACAGISTEPEEDSFEAYTRPQTLVSIAEGHRLNLWRKVHGKLAKITRVCAYDRAGFGFSDPGPLPRTTSKLTADFEALLKAANLQGPYVLVGHSSASLNLRLFVDGHIDQVAGLVLVDPSIEFQEQRFTSVSQRWPRLFGQGYKWISDRACPEERDP
jgi:Alpha/beta hydrolase family